MLRRVLVFVMALALVPAIAPADDVDAQMLIYGSMFLPGDDDVAPFVLPSGSRLTMTDASLGGHTVTSFDKTPDGRPLFDAGPVPSFGKSAAVEGVEHLAAGAYRFYCSNHPGMQGTLIVT